MTCHHHLHDGTLCCTRTDAHDEHADHGHVYEASDCSTEEEPDE